jgi:hypothetical protein
MVESDDVKLEKGLTKLLNSEIFKNIYPMIDNIEVYDLKPVNSTHLVIRVNDPEMTKDNMYERGMDPHYLIDRHLASFLPYYGVPRSKLIGFTLIGPGNKTIDTYIGSLN